MADDGGIQVSPPASGSPPKKRRCGLGSKEEEVARLKALRAKWGPVELKEERRKANALQRKLRKEAETARLTPLGPQVLFFRTFLALRVLTYCFAGRHGGAGRPVGDSSSPTCQDTVRPSSH